MSEDLPIALLATGTQSANAIEDIEKQISDIQASTGESADVIWAISDIILEMDQITDTVEVVVDGQEFLICAFP